MYPYNGVSGSANWTVTPVISQDGEPWQSGNPSAPADGTYLSWIKAILDRLQNLKAIAGLLGSNNTWTNTNTFQPTTSGKAVTFGDQLDEVAFFPPAQFANLANIVGGGGELHVKSGGKFHVESGAAQVQIDDGLDCENRVHIGTDANATATVENNDIWTIGALGTADRTLTLNAPAGNRKVSFIVVWYPQGSSPGANDFGGGVGASSFNLTIQAASGAGSMSVLWTHNTSTPTSVYDEPIWAGLFFYTGSVWRYVNLAHPKA